MENRPRFGSPELEVKLICDTLNIVCEDANVRALHLVANSVYAFEKLIYYH
jgi:hypothetical protein